MDGNRILPRAGARVHTNYCFISIAYLKSHNMHYGTLNLNAAKFRGHMIKSCTRANTDHDPFDKAQYTADAAEAGDVERDETTKIVLHSVNSSPRRAHMVLASAGIRKNGPMQVSIRTKNTRTSFTLARYRQDAR